MKYIATVILTVLAIMLVSISFLHTRSDDHSFSLTIIPKVEKGEIESQRYVQYSGDPGSLLFGYRHQVKHVEMELPRVYLNFKSKTEAEINAQAQSNKDEKGREYTFGFSKWTAGEESSDFYGSYTYVKFWAIEAGLCLASIPFLFVFILPLKSKAAPNAGAKSEAAAGVQ